ncbi:aryl-sulfate sulfotransferase [Halorussus limi]|uniref:Aryl-sulfate sulfotransferase n=1 Tax=Halorussus limi TaxID=2938695 RepID=A0A8U0HV38_9EURY|nr:arylsulfotransferase family protein [Halorussus limi]UPV74910.1 aryl-sulfate sulfotransferase [Halorussus limi]
MPDLSDPSVRGLAFVLAGLVLLVGAFGASWALAPDTDAVSDRISASDTLLVGVQGPGPNGNVTALDGRGDVRWSLGDIISYQSVEKLDNGSVLASFAAGGYRNCGPYDPPCKRTGVRIVDPGPEPRVVWQWSYPVRTREDSEVHDAEMLPSGNVLVADMEFESIFVLNPKTGERVWTWNASQHYDGPADPTTTDWLHLNDVDRIGDGRYLVSIRNMNQLLVVERGRGVVEVVNRDGDADVLNKQHNPHWLGDGALVVADSENHRVVELHRNDTTGEWEVAWSVAKVGGISLDWPRDADRLPNGNTLITDSRNNRVVEVRENGSLAASYSVPSLPYEADRLPHGESAAKSVSPYGVGHTADTGLLDRRIPVLSTLLAGARHVVALPYWVSEGHLLAVGVALALWIRGGHLLVRGRRSGE